MVSNHSQLYSRYFHFRGMLFALIFAAAILAVGIICSIVTWKMAFIEERITKVEGIIGSLASLVCIAINISFLATGDVLSVPMALATLFVMVNIAMTERTRSEERLQERLRKLGPLIYIGEKPIEHPPSESLSLPRKHNNEDDGSLT